MAGNAAKVRASADEAIGFCDDHGLGVWRGWFKLYRGWALSEQEGGVDEGVAEMAAEVAVNEASGAQLNASFLLGLLAGGEARRGNHLRALTLLDEALAKRGGDLLVLSDLHRRRGEILAARGTEHLDVAAESLRTAIRVAEAHRIVPFRQRAEAALLILEQQRQALSPARGGGRQQISPPASGSCSAWSAGD